jgi:16S rRNA (guanine1207-N2)-methyltransferase
MMFEAEVRGVPLRFETRAGLFSPAGPDPGTLALLERVELGDGDRLLDLGCGYGLVGCWAAAVIGPQNVWLLDNDPAAVACARRNLHLNGLDGAAVVLSDGFSGLGETGFSTIVCHPPYHSDFAVAKSFIEKGFNRLAIGGALFMVTRRLDWYRNRLTAIFGGVQVRETAGYFTFRAEKRSARYASARR